MTATARCMLCRGRFEPDLFVGHECLPVRYSHRWTPCPEGACSLCDDRRARQWQYMETEHG